MLRVALEQPAGRRPWVVYASSREVYGDPATLPVPEDAPLEPVNIYGRSKAAAEAAVGRAREAGLATAIVRFSNVFGSTADHRDRVVPAFARAAATGGTISIEGAENTFDFTHVEDVGRGLALLVECLKDGHRALPPIHYRRRPRRVAGRAGRDGPGGRAGPGRDPHRHRPAISTWRISGAIRHGRRRCWAGGPRSRSRTACAG